MGSGEEVEGGFDEGGAKGGAVGGILDDCAEVQRQRLLYAEFGYGYAWEVVSPINHCYQRGDQAGSAGCCGHV